MKRALLTLLAAALFATPAWAVEDGGKVKLPEPERSGGMSLLEALEKRSSSREFDGKADLTEQDLSTLLWGTAGNNRPDGFKVYPTALNVQDMTIYVFKRDGVYRYDEAEHALILTVEGDHRAESGKQPYVGSAAVNLVCVQDAARWKADRMPVDIPAEAIRDCGRIHSGAIMQNASLCAAARGWSAVPRTSFDNASLAKLLNLKEGQSVTLVLSIGPAPTKQ